MLRYALRRIAGIVPTLLVIVTVSFFVVRLAHGDFGPSFKQHDFSVTELIYQGLPVSGSLGITAILLAILIGIPSGLLAALWRRTTVDYGISSLVVLGMALPAFVIGPVLALVFGVYLQWLPVAGWEEGSPRYYVLPALTLALPVIAYVAR